MALSRFEKCFAPVFNYFINLKRNMNLLFHISIANNSFKLRFHFVNDQVSKGNQLQVGLIHIRS
jgi:hypothetical protein